MKRSVAAVALALGSAAWGLQEPDEGERWKRIQTAVEEERPAKARILLEEFLKLHPESTRVPAALLGLARTYRRESTYERGVAIEVLRRLHAEFPESPETSRSVADVARFTGWSFAQAPSFVIGGGERTISLRRNAEKGREYGPRIALRFYRVPTDVYRQAVQAAWTSGEDDGTAWLSIPRNQWHFWGEKTLEYPRSDSGPQSVSFNFARPGVYLMEEIIEGFRNVERIFAGSFGVAVKSLPGRTLVYAMDPATGEPVPGIDVALWAKGKPEARFTDERGLAFFETGSGTGILASRGDEAYACNLGERDPETPDSLVYITTDRPVYRPGQTVSYKAVWRDRKGESLSFRPGGKVRVDVRDPDGRIMKSDEPAWNDAGSVSGSFTLGDEPPLGDYRVVVRVESREGDAYFFRLEEPGEKSFWTKRFLVAAYRKPEVKVSVELSDRAPIRGAEVRARVRAEYYFGGPVAGAEVEWEVESGWGARPDSRWPRPPFEDPRLWFVGPDDPQDPGFGGPEIASGKGMTGADGTLEVAFRVPPEVNDEECVVKARVRDVSRLEAAGSARFRTHASALRPSVGTARMFYRPGDRIQARVRVVTAEGKPAAGRIVDLVALMAAAAANEGGEVEFEPFFAGKSPADARGLAVFDFTAEQAGRLRLRATVKDDAGRPAVDRADLWVAGEEAVAIPREASLDLSVLADRVVYEEGETAQIMVRSAAKPLTALLTIEGGTFHEARIVRLARRCEVLEIPIKAEYGPNAFVKLHSWKDGAAYGGGFEIFVYPRRRFLDVEVSTDREAYGPRQKARVTVATLSKAGPVPAEVELGVVDESIYAIAADKTRDIRKFFHRRREDEVSVSGTCAPAEGYDSYAWQRSGGGPLTGATFALDEPRKLVPMTAAVEFVPTETRRFFPDTLAWLAHVRTDERGRAEVELEMPDSLTTWRVVARAVSGADRIGQGVSSMLTRKDVIVRLTAPRFLTERDSATVSTTVHNDLPAEAEFTVRLKVEGAEAEAGERLVKVPSRGVKRLDWKIRATRAGTAKLTAETLSSAGSDAMEISLPVRPHGIEEHVAKAGRVTDRWVETLALPRDAARETASLEVTVSAGGMSAVLEALPFLAGYPYGCVEQTMSRFLPSVAAWGALKRLGIANPALEKALPDMVDRGLQRLYGFQHEDGGWGWWTHDQTHPFMTAYALHGLLAARQAGFAVDEGTVQKGLVRLASMEPTAFGIYVLKQGGALEAKGPEDYRARVKNVEHEFRYRPEKPEDRAYLVLAGRHDLARGLAAVLPEKADGETVRQAALVLRAIAAADARDARIGALVEWLLARRVGHAWISTLDSAYAVYALTAVAAAEEAPAVTVLLNGREVSSKAGRVVLPGASLQAGENTVEVRRARGDLVFASALLRYYSQAESLAPGRGALVVARRFERAYVEEGRQKWEILESGSEVAVGDEVRVGVTLRVREGTEYVMLECPIPAGAEAFPADPEDPEVWGYWYGRREMRDDRACVAAHQLFGAVNEFTFRLRPTFPGEYHVMPASAFGMYAPNRRGTSGEFLLRVVDRP